MEHEILISPDESCPSQLLIGADFMRNINVRGINISLELHQNRICFGTEQISLIAYINATFSRPINMPMEKIYPFIAKQKWNPSLRW